jgi:hypothetical protein
VDVVQGGVYQSLRVTPLPSLNPPARILIQSTSTQMPLAKLHTVIRITRTMPQTAPATWAEAFSRMPVRPAQHRPHEPKMKKMPVSSLKMPATM